MKTHVLDDQFERLFLWYFWLPSQIEWLCQMFWFEDLNILCGGPIEQFFISASAPQLV